MIRKNKSTYEVRSKDGKKLLGKHKSKTGTLKQLRAIEANKNRTVYE